MTIAETSKAIDTSMKLFSLVERSIEKICDDFRNGRYVQGSLKIVAAGAISIGAAYIIAQSNK